MERQRVSKMILGFDVKYRDGTWVKSLCNGKIQYETWSYSKYKSMHKRCLVGGAGQRNYPSYVGCHTSENFKDFQFFAEWSSNQIGYERESWHLDKDILVKGNKLYSENTCAFVPTAINGLLIDKKALRGEWPIGVYFNKRDEVFTAYVCRDGKLEHISSHNNPYAAFLAYKREKERYIKDVANRWKPDVDIRVYDALMNYTVEITD